MIDRADKYKILTFFSLALACSLVLVGCSSAKETTSSTYEYKTEENKSSKSTDTYTYENYKDPSSKEVEANELPTFEEMKSNPNSYLGKYYKINGKVTNVTGSLRAEYYQVAVYWTDAEIYGEVAIIHIPSKSYKTTVYGGRIFSGNGCFKGIDDGGRPYFEVTDYDVKKAS